MSSLLDGVRQAWAMSIGSRMEQDRIGGPLACANLGIQCIRLIAAQLGAVFSKDAAGRLAGTPIATGDFDMALAQTILGVRAFAEEVIQFCDATTVDAATALLLQEVIVLFQVSFGVFYPTRPLQVSLIDQLLRDAQNQRVLMLQVVLSVFTLPGSRLLKVFQSRKPGSSADDVVVFTPEPVSGEEAYESIQLSSNTHQLDKIKSADDLSTHWESNDGNGKHHILVAMLPDVNVTAISLVVTTRDSYRPKDLTIFVGDSKTDMTQIGTVLCDSARKDNSIPIACLDELSEYYAYVKIAINADGINCKINGIKVQGALVAQSTLNTGNEEAAAGPFRDFVTAQQPGETGAANDVDPQVVFEELTKQLLLLVTDVAASE